MFENPYVSISSAIVFIASHEWLTVQQFIEGRTAKDFFWNNPFQDVGAYFDMTKTKVLNYLKRESWTADEWEAAQRTNRLGVSSSLELMKHAVSKLCAQYRLSSEEIKEKLEYSIKLEKEITKKLRDAEQTLVNAARAENIKIYGTKNGGDGDNLAVPLEFLRRSDFETNLDEDKFIPLVDGSTTLGQFRKRQSVDAIGWRELQVNKEDVKKLWPAPDVLAFDKIAKNQMLSPKLSPDETMQELVQAFFRGEFERDGISLIFRTDLAPTTPPPPDGENDALDWQGHYWNGSDGVTYKTGADGEQYPTADRQHIKVERRIFAEVLGGTEYMPWRWDGTAEGLQGIAAILLASWPEEAGRVHFEKWCIEKPDFEVWAIRRGYGEKKTAVIIQENKPKNSSDAAATSTVKKTKKPAAKRNAVKDYISKMPNPPKHASGEIVEAIRRGLSYTSLDDETVRGAIRDLEQENKSLKLR